MSSWIKVGTTNPIEGELVLVFRPQATETNDPVIALATYKEGRTNRSLQDVKHDFSCWCHPTYWARIPDPTDNMIFPDSTEELKG